MAKGRTSETLYNELRKQNAKGMSNISYDDFVTGLRENRKFAEAIHRRVKEAQHISTDRFLELTFPEDNIPNYEASQAVQSGNIRRSPDTAPTTDLSDKIQKDIQAESPQRFKQENVFPNKVGKQRSQADIRADLEKRHATPGQEVSEEMYLRKAVETVGGKREKGIYAFMTLLKNKDSMSDIEFRNQAFRIQNKFGVTDVVNDYIRGGTTHHLDNELTERLKNKFNYFAVKDNIKFDKKAAVEKGYRNLENFYREEFPTRPILEEFEKADYTKLDKAVKATLGERNDLELDDKGTASRMKGSLADFVDYKDSNDLTTMYVSQLYQEYKRLSPIVEREIRNYNGNPKAIVADDNSPFGIRRGLKMLGEYAMVARYGESNDYKRWVQVVRDLMALAPLVNKGVTPSSIAPDQGGFERFSVAAGNMLFRDATLIAGTNKQELANQLMGALNRAGVPLDKKTQKIVSAEAKANFWEKSQDLVGTTAGIIAPMVLVSTPSGGAAKAVNKFLDIQNKSMALKWGVRAFNTGVNYQMAGMISANTRAQDELTMGTGATGSIASSAVLTGLGLMNKPAQELTRPMLTWLMGRVGAGLGEVAEETTQEFYQSYIKTDSFIKAKEDFSRKFGNISDAGFFFVGSFLMGTTMNAFSAESTQELKEMAVEALARTPEQELARLSEIIGVDIDQTNEEDQEAPSQTESTNEQEVSGDTNEQATTSEPATDSTSETEPSNVDPNTTTNTEEAAPTTQPAAEETTETTPEATTETTGEVEETTPESTEEVAEETTLEETTEETSPPTEVAEEAPTDQEQTVSTEQQSVISEEEAFYNDPNNKAEGGAYLGKNPDNHMKKQYDEGGNATMGVRKVKGKLRIITKGEDGNLTVRQIDKNGVETIVDPTAGEIRAFNSKKRTQYQDAVDTRMEEAGFTYNSRAGRITVDESRSVEENLADLKALYEYMDTSIPQIALDPFERMFPAVRAEINRLNDKQSGVTLNHGQDGKIDEDADQAIDEEVAEETTEDQEREFTIRTGNSRRDVTESTNLKNDLDRNFPDLEEDVLATIKTDIEASVSGNSRNTLSPRGLEIMNGPVGQRLKTLASRGDRLALKFTRLRTPKQATDAEAQRSRRNTVRQNRVKAQKKITQKLTSTIENVRNKFKSNSKASKAIKRQAEKLRAELERHFTASPARTRASAIEAFDSMIGQYAELNQLYNQLTEEIEANISADQVQEVSEFNSPKTLAKAMASNLLFSPTARRTAQFSSDVNDHIINHYASEVNSVAEKAEKLRNEIAEEFEGDMAFIEDSELRGMSDRRRANPHAHEPYRGSSTTRTPGQLPGRLEDLVGIEEVSPDPSIRSRKITTVIREVIERVQSNSGRSRMHLIFAKMMPGWIGSYNAQTDQIRTRHRQSIRTFAHEFGHYVDENIFNAGTRMRNRRNSPRLIEPVMDPADPMNPELIVLADYGSPADRSDPNLYTARMEGLAAYFEGYVLNPAEMRRRFPNITERLFENMDSSMSDALNDLSTYYVHLMNSSQADVAAAHIAAIDGTDIPNQREVQRQRKAYFKRILGPLYELKTGAFNAMYPAIKIYERVMESRGRDTRAFHDSSDSRSISPLQDFRKLARRLLGYNESFAMMIRHGLIDSDGNIIIDSRTNQPMTANWLFDSMTQSDVDQMKEEIKMVEAWMISERVRFLVAREQTKDNPMFDENSTITGMGSETITDLESAEIVAAEMRSLSVTDPELYGRLEEAKRRYQKYARALLEYQVGAGRMTRKDFNEIVENNHEYVTMQRIMYELNDTTDGGRDAPVQGVGGFSIAQTNEFIKKFKGSSRQIANPYVSMLGNMNKMIREAERNRAMSAWVDAMTPQAGDNMEMARSMQMVMQDVTSTVVDADGNIVASRQSPALKNTIKVYQNGNLRYYRVAPEMLKPLTDMYKMADSYANNAYFQGIAKAAQIFRAGIIYFPAFMMNNTVRDTLQRIFVTGSGNVANLRDYRITEQDRIDLRAQGGAMAGYIASTDVNRYYDVIAQSIEELSGNGETIYSALTGGDLRTAAQKTATGLQRFAESTENINRVAEYKAAYREAREKGYSEQEAKIHAAYKARDLMDFAVTGEWIKGIRAVFPFMNAALQGTSKLYRQATSGDFVTINGRQLPVRQGAVRMGAGIAMLGAMSFLLRMLATMDPEDDEKYRKLPAYERDLYWNFFLGNKHLRLAKPFEAGVLASTMERGLSYMILGEKDAFAGHAHMAAEKLFAPMAAGKRVLKGVEVLRGTENYDDFRQRFIVPPWEHGSNLKDRDTYSASALSKALTEFKIGDKQFNQIVQDALGTDALDPRKIDYFVKSNFGYFGNTVLKGSSSVANSKESPQFAAFSGPLDVFLQVTGLGKEYSHSNSEDIQWIANEAQKMGLRALKKDKETGFYPAGDLKLLGEFKKDYYLTDKTRNREQFILRGEALQSEAKRIRKEWESEGKLKEYYEKYSDIKTKQREARRKQAIDLLNQ